MRSLRAMLLLAVLLPSAGYANNRYVSPDGEDAGSCATITGACRSIQYTLSRSLMSNTVLVAQGIYTENLVVDLNLLTASSLTIEGGWSLDFSTQVDDPTRTVVEAVGVGPTIRITGRDVSTGYLNMRNLTVRGGRGNPGGGIHADADQQAFQIELENVRVERNRAAIGGGVRLVATRWSQGTLLLNACRILTNSADENGGGLAIEAFQNAALDVTVSNTVLAENGAPADGGGLFLNAETGARIDLQLVNATLANNAPDGVFVIHDREDGSTVFVDMVNTIAWLNGRDVHLRGVLPQQDIKISYSLPGVIHYVGAPTIGDGVLMNEDPLFVDAARGDYRIRPESPARDAGICGIGPRRIAPYLDFEGQNRPPYGSEFGCDIGADEYVFVPILSVPTGRDTYTCEHPLWPMITDDPETLQPFSSGDPVSSGVWNLQVGLPATDGPVDIYLVIYAPLLDPDNLYLIGPDLSIQPLSSGLIAWRENVMEAINERLFGFIPTATLPLGTYVSWVFMTPPGSTDAYFGWMTPFEAVLPAP